MTKTASINVTLVVRTDHMRKRLRRVRPDTVSLWFEPGAKALSMHPVAECPPEFRSSSFGMRDASKVRQGGQN